jgi:hypothetical protein
MYRAKCNSTVPISTVDLRLIIVLSKWLTGPVFRASIPACLFIHKIACCRLSHCCRDLTLSKSTKCIHLQSYYYSILFRRNSSRLPGQAQVCGRPDVSGASMSMPMRNPVASMQVLIHHFVLKVMVNLSSNSHYRSNNDQALGTQKSCARLTATQTF